jgi:putative tricarboxylic transport membrane protein
MTGLVKWPNFSISIGIAFFGVIYIVWAGTYPRDLGTLPGLVGWLTVILGLLDALSYTNTTAGAKVRRLVGHIEEEDGKKEAAANWMTIAASIGWLVAYVAAVAFFGFIATTPIYIVLYMWLFGKRSLRSSIISSLIVTGLIGFTFEYLFQYPLFSGLLFGGTF